MPQKVAEKSLTPEQLAEIQRQIKIEKMVKEEKKREETAKKETLYNYEGDMLTKLQIRNRKNKGCGIRVSNIETLLS